MENVIDKLRELEAKASSYYRMVGDDDWREIDDILDAYKPEGYEIDEVESRQGEGGRWTTREITTYKITQTDGKVAHFKIDRECPATEMQEGGDFAFEIWEVVPREVTVTKYIPGRAA
ncbi:hypothetical protein BSK66_07820 [Paenibacillus odorifer]|uniref:Uncharacterized protein n=1 Tax=Paenibacillus odorifer TaxID=189426 RepID=A0A1R0X2N8_9BACL|nr:MULTISPECIES: hypothetical protein [Paenibacillus]ETT64910.1 hypothetical protein C171_07837 [Paenibacillus sp. FSL H8-237]OMD27467.1 hypothetical protein BJP51_25050 [Paenibacillus odorifer]OME61029.1 hypothetical protein BSK66_07820 [Paenibacillus odorifer]OZQ84688.1 hypothetical protein CA598_23120 [Paenibacillus sp. VTT E-133291]